MNRASIITVICVIAVIVALIVPAVHKVRRAAAMTQCENNLKQVALGIASYHDSHRKFPLAVMKYTIRGNQQRTVELPIEKQASWLYEIHPWLEARMDPRFAIDVNKPWDAEENRYVADSEYRLFQCAEALGDGIVDTTQTTYIAMLGLGRDAGSATKDDKGRGVFGFFHHVTRADIEDGAANTMAIAETARDNGPWIAGGYPTARGVDPDGPPYLGRTGQFGSLHPGVSMVGMVDGSVRRLNADTSPTVIEALSTIVGGEPVD